MSSIPPIKLRPRTSRSGAALSGRAVDCSLPPLLEEGLDFSAKSRLDYYERLTPLSLSIVENLESDLDAIENQFIAYKSLLGHNQVAAGHAKTAFNDSIYELETNYREHYINTIYLESINEDSSYADFAFFKEVTINIVVNKLAYLAEIEANIHYYMKRILSELLRHDRPVDPGAVRFSIDIPDSETHNRGKSAAFISFFLKGEPLGKVVYKPRSARIDKKIIELFNDINHLPEVDRSSSDQLPTYTILSLGTASMWEFIYGKHIKTSSSVGWFIRRQEGKEWEILSKKLNRIDAILTLIRASDLHAENVFVKRIKRKTPEIIPIDLENIQLTEHTRTELGGQPHLVKLKEEELALINAFNESIYNIEYRYIPYSTEDFVNLIADHTKAEHLAEMVRKRLIEDGYTLCIDHESLRKECLRDMLSLDIPYFTEFQGKLYYGTVEREVIIAKCKSDK